MTSFGKPYTADLWGNPIEGRLQPTGIIMALDSDTGKILWQFNVGYKIGVGGPSIGHGMLFVPTEGENIGSLIAFGLP
jgi:outer membrane protein assembly factor BamB